MKTYTKEQKKEIINRYLNGESVSYLSKSSGVSRSTIHLWIDEHTQNSKICKDMNLRDIHDLKVKSERQEKMLEIIRISGCSTNSPQIEKYNAISSLSDRYNVNTLCEALGVAKGSYYNHILRNKKGNTLKAKRYAELKPVIENIFNESRQIFDSGKIAAVLKTQGYKISESSVAKIMHENGWFSIRRSAKTLYLQEQQRKQNILNQEFHAARPNEIWISDVTYFSVKDKNYYICVIMDLFARKVVVCKVSYKNSTQFTKATFNIAYENRNPIESLLFHSDQGCNHTSKGFMKHLRNLGIKQSFSRKATPYDNSVMESFFANMKQEELYRTNFRSEKEFKETVARYIEFYNNKRPHSTLRYLTPNKVEENYYKKISSNNNGS